MTLNRHQQRSLDTDRRLLLDVADVVATLPASLRAAHDAAAVLSAAGPGSSWAGDRQGGSGGTHSDPTGTAATDDAPTVDLLGDLRSAMHRLRDAAYAAHQATANLCGRLQADDRRRQIDDELDAENRTGEGNCDACDRWCCGSAADRLSTMRKLDAYGGGLRFCLACRMAWQRAGMDSDAIYAWVDDRRRGREREAG